MIGESCDGIISFVYVHVMDFLKTQEEKIIFLFFCQKSTRIQRITNMIQIWTSKSQLKNYSQKTERLNASQKAEYGDLTSVISESQQ